MEIKNKLRRGDYLIISEMTGYAKGTVIAMFNGHRKMQQKVVNAAIKIVENRENLIKNNKQE